MELLYKIVTVLRFFQLFGGALMASNTTVFLPGSLTYNTISIMSVFFHLIPCQYRNGIEYLALFALNTILFLFAIYLLIASSYYKKTSKVSKVTTYVLPVFMATGPFLFLPILAEFCGEILSGAISGNHPVKITEYIAVAESLVITVFYLWLLFQTFTTTLIFRSCSFKSLEGGPQNKLLLGTIIVTFICALNIHLTKGTSVAVISISVIVYAYLITTVYGCGTFINLHHQSLVLGGCFLAIILCLANLYPTLTRYTWTEIFFVWFGSAAIVCFAIAQIFIKARTLSLIHI